MWCPTGVNPGAGCTSATSFSILLSSIKNKTVPGTIWIESTYVGTTALEGGSVTLDSSLGTTANFALTLKGGWNGTLGSLAAITGTSTFNVPLTINWNSDVTLSNITITGITGSSSPALSITTPKSVTLTAVNVNTNSGSGAKINNTSSTTASAVTVSSSTFSSNAGGDGLDIFSKGAITLNSVTANSNGNGGNGADLDNCVYGDSLNHTQGCTVLTSAPVTVTGGTFSYNGGTGLNIESTGTITGNGLTATYNGSFGAWLDNCNSYVYKADGSQKCSTSAAHAVTLNGTNNFSYNDSDGLELNSTGAITINNLTASYNTTLNGYGRGAAINNCNNTYEPNGGICTVASAPVTLTGTNTFNGNWANGLQIDSTGAITISNLNANYNGRANTNGGAGAQLNNCENYGIPQCSTSVVHAITLTGNNTFDNNYFDGLDITAYGPIAASNITADDNGTSASDVNAIYYTGGSGASWDNCVWSSSTDSCTGSSTVTLTGINQFNGNYSDLISTDPSNPYNFSQGGLTITSGGAITVNNVTANGDLGGDGAYIYNNITATAQAITVNNTLSNTFNGNAVNGLEVDSIGVINVSNITANTNGNDGAYLDNCILNNSGQCSAAAAQSVTVTNTTLNTFNGNYGNGLDVESYGSITASNLNASDNGTSSTPGTGVSLNNDYANYKSVNSTGTVTLAGVNEFDYNYSGGLNALSKGAIALTDMDAIGNTGNGAYLNNTSGTIAAGVTLINTNVFAENSDNGLEVHTNGAITASNLVANNNDGLGAWLDNCGYNTGSGLCTTSTVAPVTVSGNNQFKDNYDNDGLSPLFESSGGLAVFSNGLITLNNITASNNFNSGVWVDNTHSPTFQGVNITGMNLFDANGGTGLSVYTSGPVTASNLTATNNGSLFPASGVDIENWTATTAQPVTLTGTNYMSNNNLEGLNVLTRGAITINNLTANKSRDDNQGFGAYLDSADYPLPSAPQNVTLTGYANFNNNAASGLNIRAYGTITLNNVTANNNGNDGVDLDNDFTGAVGGVNVTNTANSLSNNKSSGLYVLSKGLVTLSNITASSNGSYNTGTDTYTGEGIYVDNTAGVAGVTLIGTNVTSSNWTNGLDVVSKGAISINNLTANKNGYYDTPTDTKDDAVNGYGASLDNSTASAAQPITLTGTNQFNNNMYDGLGVSSNGGAVTLNGLIANGNGLAHNPDPNINPNSSGYGVEVDNTSSGTAVGNVTLTGTNVFNSNWLDGLDIFSYGNITLNNVTASNNGIGTYDNFGAGAWLDNCLTTNGTTCQAVTPKTITLAGNNAFENNFSDGLLIASKGAITVNNVNADGNGADGSDGAYLDNDFTGAVGGVNVTNTAAYSPSFNDNGNHGLEVYSLGAITVMDLDASGNNRYGVRLYNSDGTGNVSLGTARVGWSNWLKDNGLNGLDVSSKGLVTLANIDAENNGYYDNVAFQSYGFGAYIDNTSSTTGMGVTLTGTNVFNGNYLSGLEIYSNGNITLNSIQANNNGYNDPSSNDNANLYGYGAYIDNSNVPSLTPKIVTLTGVNQFNGNLLDGLDVASKGAVTLNSITANGNGLAYADPNTSTNTSGNGVLVDNTYSGTAVGQSVSLTGTNVFDNNWLEGLIVFSYGNLTLNSVTANNNGQGHYEGYAAGAWLNNCNDNNVVSCLAVTPKTIILTGTNQFNDNGEDGLFIWSNGAITLNSITASYNGLAHDPDPSTNPSSSGYGVDVVNTYSGTAVGQNVTLTGTNQFNNNWLEGLQIFSYGNIALNSISASNNGQGQYGNGFGSGVWLSNCLSNDGGITCQAVTPKTITLTGNNAFENNYGSGLWTASKGAITVNNVNADGNGSDGGDGAYLNNDYPGAVGGVSVTNTATYSPSFNGNGYNGSGSL